MRLGHAVIQHQLQDVASGLPGRWTGTALLECLNTFGQLRIIGHHHPTHCGRNCLGLLAAEEGGTAKAANWSTVVGSTQGVYAVFDKVQAMPAR